jgi:hypothetical protein
VEANSTGGQGSRRAVAPSDDDEALWNNAIAQPVWRLATGWTVRGSSPGGGDVFCTPPERPWSPPPPSLLNNKYRFIPGGEAAGAWR